MSDVRAERLERNFEIPLLIAAAATIPMIVISESDVSQQVKQVGQAINWVSWLVFLAHFVAMLAVVPDRWRWIRDHPLEVAVTVLTPPILPSSLQALRAVRLLRLTRLLAFVKFSRSAFSLTGLKFAAFGALITAIGGGLTFRAFEHRQNLTEWESFYWALTTMTTLGSNIYPSTTGAEIVSAIILMIGIAFIAMLTGAIAQNFLATRPANRPNSEAPKDPPASSERRN